MQKKAHIAKTRNETIVGIADEGEVGLVFDHVQVLTEPEVFLDVGERGGQVLCCWGLLKTISHGHIWHKVGGVGVYVG